MHGTAQLTGGRSHMMATAAVIGLSGGKRLLSSTFYYSDLNEKLCCHNMNDSVQPLPSTKNVITAKKSSDYSPSPSCFSSNQHMQPIKALKEHVDTSASVADPWFELEEAVEPSKLSVDALLLLQKSLLEKQWNLSLEHKMLIRERENPCNKNTAIGGVTCSGVSARQRRTNNNSKRARKQHPASSIISPELLQIRSRGYVKGVISEELLTHAQVVRLSKKIKTGLSLEEHKSRLEQRLGHEPSDEQLAMSLRISRAQLQSKQIECTLAREKLAMSNVRLVMSIAQRYDNMGAEMADLIQGGLIGLLRGIEKFDSSKGFKISTYVYWWIRQGVSRALVENSRTLRLPTHLHERLSLIRNAKTRLEQKGITPSIDRIAECLNMTQKKVRNATEAVNKVISLDKEAFPSLNGLPGETLHSYIADNRIENNPWHGFDEWALKDEVKKLIDTTLGERERDIIRLYYGMDNECLTWEDISKRIGLSRERVRQVGLLALEKLKHAARNRMLDAMLLKH